MTTSYPTEFGGLDFELTDFEEAKRCHDQLPPGVTTAQTLEPGYWIGQRRTPGANDRALSGQAIQWVLELPAEMRPKTLIDRFPRIANRLAECSPQPTEFKALLQDLLVDRRGRRRGFPPEVAAEIEALRDFVAAQARQT